MAQFVEVAMGYGLACWLAFIFSSSASSSPSFPPHNIITINCSAASLTASIPLLLSPPLNQPPPLSAPHRLLS